MPYVLSWEPGVVIKTFTGHLTSTEFVKSAEDVAAHEQFDSLRFIVNDWRGCTGHSIDSEALESIAIIRLGSMASNPNIRVIVISTDERFTKLVSATREPPLAGTHETVAVATLEEARDWMARQPRLDQARPLRFHT